MVLHLSSSRNGGGGNGVQALNTTTPALHLNKPAVGADDDLWGDYWNENADILDAAVLWSDPANQALASLSLTGPLFLNLTAGGDYIEASGAGQLTFDANGVMLQAAATGTPETAAVWSNTFHFGPNGMIASSPSNSAPMPFVGVSQGAYTAGLLADGANSRTVLATLDAAGNIASTLGYFDSVGNLTVNNRLTVMGRTLFLFGTGGFFFTEDDTAIYQEYTAGYFWLWHRTGGDLMYIIASLSNPILWLRNDNLWAQNSLAPFAGNGAYVNFSDARLKASIRPAIEGLDVLRQLRPKRFVRKDRELEHDEIGFIAQDVQAALPEAVWNVGRLGRDATDEPGSLGLTTDAIVAVLVNAVQELDRWVQATDKWLMLDDTTDSQAADSQ